MRLAELVQTQLSEAVRVLQARDAAWAAHLDAYDATINQLRYAVEEQAYEMLALQQPNARDLRRIVAAVSITTNLERMGDHAADIARIVRRLDGVPQTVDVPEFMVMARLAQTNLGDAMRALAGQDAALARRIVARDGEIDALHSGVYTRLIQIMTGNPATVEFATLMLWVSHDIERFGDRTSNICERIIYTVTGNLFEPRRAEVP